MRKHRIAPAGIKAGRRQSGVSMVEVLVTTVVTSIGLLGLAGLQASGMRVEQGSIHRGQAAQLAYDMVDRMRANVASADDYALALGAATPEGTTRAERDLQDWRLRLRSLPAGTGSVALNGNAVTVVVQWDDSRGAGVLRGTESDDAARLAQQAAQFSITAQLAN